MQKSVMFEWRGKTKFKRAQNTSILSKEHHGPSVGSLWLVLPCGNKECFRTKNTITAVKTFSDYFATYLYFEVIRKVKLKPI